MITGVRIAVKYKHKFFPVFAQALTRGKCLYMWMICKQSKKESAQSDKVRLLTCLHEQQRNRLQDSEQTLSRQCQKCNQSHVGGDGLPRQDAKVWEYTETRTQVECSS